ncbi:MAG: acetyl-CoA carboxylase carboxyltransferase subunit alpha [Cyanobacteria bacterium P01_H01_bin.74]
MTSKPPKDITPLDFEKPIVEIEDRIQALLSQVSEQVSQHGETLDDEIEALKNKAQTIRNKVYAALTPLQKLQIARHPQRPNFTELIQLLSPECWFELHGDRAGMDDRAILGGIIELACGPVMVIGTQKGKGMKENLTHNFGMANPEGYRKALKLFYHAEKFKMPILTLIDTPGAYPGIMGEQNGIGQAIAFNIREMARLKTPIVSVVTGEGASGGALGVGVANKIYMMEHALYTVISPEGCASILWRDAAFAEKAADALKITAQDLIAMGISDGIIAEPSGGGHRDPVKFAQAIVDTIVPVLSTLKQETGDALTNQRYEKYRSIGAFAIA